MIFYFCRGEVESAGYDTFWEGGGAVEVAERVREAIAGTPFLVRQLGRKESIEMTASLGVAAYPAHARSQQDLIEQADRAMQQVKSLSKNGVSVASGQSDDHDDGEAEPPATRP